MFFVFLSQFKHLRTAVALHELIGFADIGLQIIVIANCQSSLICKNSLLEQTAGFSTGNYSPESYKWLLDTKYFLLIVV